jgi:Flp pilus assembly protein TadD
MSLGDGGAILAAFADGAAPDIFSHDAPTPPPKPVTIPLVSGKEDKCDHELALGDAAFEKDDLETARVHYAAAATLDGKRAGPIVGVARVRIAKLGLAMDYAAGKGNADLVAAGRELRRATQLEPRFGPAHVELGRALLLAGDADGALRALSKGVELVPDQAEAHSALGVARLATGHADDAVASLGRAAELDPGRAERHGNYGTALLMRGRVPDAVREYELQARRTTRARTPISARRSSPRTSSIAVSPSSRARSLQIRSAHRTSRTSATRCSSRARRRRPSRSTVRR